LPHGLVGQKVRNHGYPKKKRKKRKKKEEEEEAINKGLAS
jgi:hypothetical protein